MIPVLAGAATLLFTTVLTIVGVGSAFVLVPVFVALGVEVHAAIATGLLLNTIGMSFASVRYARRGLVEWRTAIPIMVVAAALSPLGAWVSQGLDRTVLLAMFGAFLVFAAGMMLFYRPAAGARSTSSRALLAYGVGVGGLAGFVGGLLGVGGGNLIVPVLVWLGFAPKKASGTSAAVVVVSSFSGFLSHAGMGALQPVLLGWTAPASALGAMLGAWLMTEKLRGRQVKVLVAFVLLTVAGKLLLGVLA